MTEKQRKHKGLCVSWEIDKVEELKTHCKSFRYNVSEFFRTLYEDWKKNGSETIPYEDNTVDTTV